MKQYQAVFSCCAVMFSSLLVGGTAHGQGIESKDSQIQFEHLESSGGLPHSVNQFSSDWEPFLIKVTNKSMTEDAVYKIDCNRQVYRSKGVPLNFSVLLEVPANSTRSTLVGIPNGYEGNQYNIGYLSCSVSRNGVPVPFNSSQPGQSSNQYSISINASRATNGAFRFLEVNDQSQAQFNWKFLAHAKQTVNRAWLPPDQLPQAREALIGLDAVLLSGVDPEDVSAGQRSAIRAAVRSGLTVVLKPDDKGRGLRWISGLKVEPQLISDAASGAERIEFPVEGIGQRIGTHCVQVDDGMGRWIALERPTDWYDGEKLTVSGSPLHLRTALDLLKFSPFRSLLRQIDASQHPPHPMKLMLILGFFYVGVLWPLIGMYLKKRNKLPHMLWLQPMVVTSCILLLFVVSIWRLGIMPRHLDHVLIIRSPDGSHAMAAVFETDYTPTGGISVEESVKTLAPQPISFGSDLSPCHYQQQLDGSITTTFGRRVRSTSHMVRWETIPVNPLPLTIPAYDRENLDPEKIRYSWQVLWNQLKETESQGKWVSKDDLTNVLKNHVHHVDRSTNWGVYTESVMCTTASAHLEEKTREQLGIGPEARVIVWNGTITDQSNGPGKQR
ncbi:MAG TPA: hypothetical protein EYQ08_00330 [Planctomycetes bacterium]|nr:hypothetical protein [Planctomycetota bacterium]